jgi:hypothetical protein
VTAVARPAGTADGAPEGVPELGAAIRAALGHLADLSHPPPAVLDGRLDRMLRASLKAQADGSPGGGAARRDGYRAVMDEVAAAVRTACAHLAAAELEDAYLALRAAVDRLPRRVPAAPGAEGNA